VEDVEPRREGDPQSVQLQNDDEGAVSIEYGTHRTAPHGTLVSTQTYMEKLDRVMNN